VWCISRNTLTARNCKGYTVEGEGCISRNTLPAWNYLEYSKRGGGAYSGILFQLGTTWSIVKGEGGCISRNTLSARN
jgi:hypothetical protein